MDELNIALSELKINVGKYIELAESEDVVITKYGKPAARIVRFDHEPWYMKKISEDVTSVQQLFGTLPEDMSLDEMRAERIMI